MEKSVGHVSLGFTGEAGVGEIDVESIAYKWQSRPGMPVRLPEDRVFDRGEGRVNLHGRVKVLIYQQELDAGRMGHSIGQSGSPAGPCAWRKALEGAGPKDGISRGEAEGQNQGTCSRFYCSFGSCPVLSLFLSYLQA